MKQHDIYVHLVIVSTWLKKNSIPLSFPWPFPHGPEALHPAAHCSTAEQRRGCRGHRARFTQSGGEDCRPFFHWNLDSLIKSQTCRSVKFKGCVYIYIYSKYNTLPQIVRYFYIDYTSGYILWTQMVRGIWQMQFSAWHQTAGRTGNRPQHWARYTSPFYVAVMLS